MTLQVYNTLSRTKQPFSPLKAGEATLYTCGPTVYNYAHIGNFRAYLAADTLRRWLQTGLGLRVKWVLNITDVDDKTIRDARLKYPEDEPLVALRRFTRYYEDIFFADLKALGIVPDSFAATPRATDYIPQMQDLIRRIVERGFARVINGSVFFDVKKWADQDRYGKLLALDLSQLKTGTRTLADEVEKEDLTDFALWKAAKPGEPAWDFALEGESLPGRPGWHIECSAMEESIFGLPFDIHTGGVDLVFPHHEDEIAQSACGYGIEPTRYFLHNEHLLVDGKKMSKSLGNFYTLHDLIDKGISAEAIRFFLVTSHYRTKLNLTLTALKAAESTLVRLKNFARLATAGDDGENWRSGRLPPLIAAAKAEMQAAMDDDLNTPVAIAAVHDLARLVAPLFPLDAREAQMMREFLTFAAAVFGVDFLPAEVPLPPAVEVLFAQRLAARRDKDFAASDRLRDEIAALGYAVRDQGDASTIFPLS